MPPATATASAPTAGAARPFVPEQVLLLWSDPADPVVRAFADGRARLPWPMAAVSAQQLLDGVALGDRAWTVDGRRIDPRRTALINRLPVSDRLEPGDASPAGTAARQAAWVRLRDELAGFGYASSLPTATSLQGCFGSLLDQWQDLPRLVPGLRVPEHSAASVPRALAGTVFAVDRWRPYSLGRPLAEAVAEGLPAAVRLDYAVPEGRLVHLAQVGERLFFANAPPTTTEAQHAAMVRAARALAAVSPIRVLEHAFFLGRGEPVLWSSFPVPLVSGAHPSFADLVSHGLRHDIESWPGRRPA